MAKRYGIQTNKKTPTGEWTGWIRTKRSYNYKKAIEKKDEMEKWFKATNQKVHVRIVQLGITVFRNQYVQLHTENMVTAMSLKKDHNYKYMRFTEFNSIVDKENFKLLCERSEEQINELLNFRLSGK